MFVLKVNPDRNLRPMQRKLIKEIRIAEIVIEIPVTYFRKDVPRDLAAYCGVLLHRHI
jgi:hypothetical protein